MALEQERKAVRLPAMRGSIFLLPVETAAQVFAATRVPLESRQANLAYAGLDFTTYERLKPQLLELTGEPVDAKTLEARVQSGALLTVALATMSREGLVLRVGTTLRSDRWLYVSTQSWLGVPLDETERDAAQRWLAGEYLRAFGPARAKDFAWWAGIGQREAAALSDSEIVDVGEDYLLPAGLVSAFESIEPLEADAFAALPKWDSYTMAYERSGRHRLIDEEHLTSAYSSPASTRFGATLGDGLPLLLKGGRAVATWSHKLQGNRMQVAISPFQGEDIRPEAYRTSFEAIATLLGASVGAAE